MGNTISSRSWKETPHRRGALEGLRVIEVAQGIAGPYCGRIFADHGADVVKVEPRGSGDVTRSWGPFPGGQHDIEKSGTFFFLNTGKRSVTLDVAAADDRARLRELLRDADVLIEDFGPQLKQTMINGWAPSAREAMAWIRAMEF